MRHIIIRELHMENFQKFKSESVRFGQSVTRISGENRAGKTTVQSAMLWLLFGKDVYGQTDTGRGAFDIKHIGPEGLLPHTDVSVTGTFLLVGEDGKPETVKLERRLTEQWTKQNVYKGDSTECFVNDVPLTMGDYQKYIDGIIPEDEFRMITSVTHFLSLPYSAQRQYLCQMGGVRDASDIARDNAEWRDFLGRISGRTLEEELKQVAYQRKKLKDEYERIDPAICELRKARPEEQDWNVLQARKERLQTRLDAVNASLHDRSAADELQREAIDEAGKAQSEARKKFWELTERKQALASRQKAEYRQRILDKDSRREEIKAELKKLRAQLDASETATLSYKETYASLDRDMDALLERYNEEQRKVFNAVSDDVECPLLSGFTCKSPVLMERMTENRAKAEADFNGRKAKAIEDILTAGRKKRAERDGVKQRISEGEAEAAALRSRIEANETVLESMPSHLAQLENIPELPPTDEMREISEKLIRINAEINSYEEEIKKLKSSPRADDTKLRTEKSELTRQIEDTVREQARREQIQTIDGQIEALEKKARDIAAAITDLDRDEAVCKEISKAVVEDTLKRVNSLFSLVTWQMFELQKNGLYAEVCKPTVQGVSRSLNNEARINAGIDICNAIARFKGISAPLFVDNAESVNDLMPSVGQSIRCYVAPAGTPLTMEEVK